MLSTQNFLWYLNHKAWCDSQKIKPDTYSQWLDRPIEQKLLLGVIAHAPSVPIQ